MYWHIPRPQDLVMVGTVYQAIGRGLAGAVEDGRTLVLASGDGGFLMGLSDLESLIGAAASAVVVIYNDAAYGAEIHQYGSQGLTEKANAYPRGGLQRHRPRAPGEPSWPTAASRRASGPRG